MRIVIDMQGAQSSGSRNRGIGRYTLSLVKAIVQERGTHEIILALNGQFPETIEPIRAVFEGLLLQQNIRVWHCVTPTTHLEKGNTARRHTAEWTYEAFLANQEPDFIYVTSLFEGLDDGAVTSIHCQQQKVPVAVTLYDLIPYIHPVPYLENPDVKSWYLEKIEHLRRANLWLAISESSRQEGIAHLGFSEEYSINVSTDADAEFQPITVSAEEENTLRQKYGLHHPFVMYTGGIDYRKNIEGLIRAYARLPKEVRSQHQLAIVCSVQQPSREALEGLAQQQGLAAHEVILTGFVPDEDLLALYNLCKLFIFPSWHEGFGLPALEAMRCGAPVIGANTSSLPEVIGWKEALFDPHSDKAMAQAIQKGLTDETFRAALVQHGHEQAQRFSWNASARRAIAAMEHYHLRQQQTEAVVTSPNTEPRPKLAYVSPLPPARSGIADYSAELLPELAQYYDIDVVVQQDETVSEPWIQTNCTIRSAQWLLEHAGEYDRVLYHFGNSAFHQHMFDLLEKVPGVVVLHDFFLSGIRAHQELTGTEPFSWAKALQTAHGYKSLHARYTTADIADVIYEYPVNLTVLQRARGIIVHGEYSRKLARHWYSSFTEKNWFTIPHLRTPAPAKIDRKAIRQKLGFDEEDLLVCSFGMLGPTKQNHRLLQAWLASPLATDPKAHLVFVGENHGGDYGQSLLNTITSSHMEDRIKITGWADTETFRDYLSAANIAVQLRSLSRGETSGTVLDCMNYGLATIVNANGNMADLDAAGVWMLPDDFSDAALVEALTTLAQDRTRREQLSARAVDIVRTRHKPSACALQYTEAIEHIYQREQDGLQGLVENIAKNHHPEEELASIANCMARNFPAEPRHRQLLLDISALVQQNASTEIQSLAQEALRDWLKNPPQGLKLEPVYSLENIAGYRYARRFMSHFMDITDEWAEDELVDAWAGDIFLGLAPHAASARAQQKLLQDWHNSGVGVWFALPQTAFTQDDGAEGNHKQWLEFISQFDGVACTSPEAEQNMHEWLSLHVPSQERRPLKTTQSLDIRSIL